MNRHYEQYPSLGKHNQVEKEKNPNRVLGGLRGSGTESLTMVAEDGSEQKLPSMNYVRGLESKVREQEKRIQQLERQVQSLLNGAKR